MQRREDEWQPASYADQGQGTGARQASGASSGRPAAAAPRRNVVRINLRQQTVKPNYAEQSDEDGEAPPAQQRYRPAAAAAGNPALAAFQAAPAAAAMVQQPAAVQRWQQQAAAAAPGAVPAPVDIAAAWQQPAAVPDWASHLPPAAPGGEAHAAHAAPPQHAQQHHHYGQPQHQQYSAPAAPIPQSFQPAQPPWLRKVASASGMGGGTASKASSGSAAGAVAKPAPYRSTTPGFYAGAWFLRVSLQLGAAACGCGVNLRLGTGNAERRTCKEELAWPGSGHASVMPFFCPFSLPGSDDEDEAESRSNQLDPQLCAP